MIRVEARTFKVVGDFERAARAIPPAVAAKERHYRLFLRTRVQDHAKGRPGPEKITGEYVASIGVRGDFVGTDDPRGRRLEFGYHGDPDQHGPYSHFQPAIDEVRPLFFRSIERLTADLLD